MERADTKRSVILIAIAMAVILVLGFMFMTASSKSEQTRVEQSSNKLSENVITTGLDVYYAKHNEYPSDMNQMMSELTETKSATEQALAKLKDSDYKVRGDKQSYQLTYTENGETKTITREYQKDYN